MPLLRPTLPRLSIPRRVLLSLSTGILLLLLALSATSHFKRLLFGWSGWQNYSTHTWRSLGLRCNRSIITFYTTRSEPPMLVYDPNGVAAISIDQALQRRSEWVYLADAPREFSHNFHFLSARHLSDGPANTFHALVVTIPAPLLALPFAILPLLHLRFRRRLRYRLRHNLCPTCAYDLRATTDSRCPECGLPHTAFFPPNAQNSSPPL